MRFISQYPGYGAQVRVQRQRPLGDGMVEVVQRGLYIQFTPVHAGGMLYENERRTALDYFRFRGNTQDFGESIPSNPLDRLSVFDTEEAARREGWSQEEQAEVERRLTTISQTTPEEVLLVADKPFAAPFPRYDGYSGDFYELVLRLIDDGYDVEEVLHYEVTFGPNRPALVSELAKAVEVRKELVVEA